MVTDSEPTPVPQGTPDYRQQNPICCGRFEGLFSPCIVAAVTNPPVVRALE